MATPWMQVENRKCNRKGETFFSPLLFYLMGGRLIERTVIGHRARFITPLKGPTLISGVDSIIETRAEQVLADGGGPWIGSSRYDNIGIFCKSFFVSVCLNTSE
ncbi:hypothetical protein TNIN_212301 [Trichonephila inaurata madagascariensis]|uniref:Uncharacterized protein n=1 Tax=Trichonephila inaurata madagascariensis TaxID=2747483 RepID=A0A8X6X561_9ARAC|nr:hypothetical protein TNIN_212301 [Trichonephila inaurata madagascariensis]